MLDLLVLVLLENSGGDEDVESVVDSPSHILLILVVVDGLRVAGLALQVVDESGRNVLVGGRTALDDHVSDLDGQVLQASSRPSGDVDSVLPALGLRHLLLHEVELSVGLFIVHVLSTVLDCLLNKVLLLLLSEIRASVSVVIAVVASLLAF